MSLGAHLLHWILSCLIEPAPSVLATRAKMAAIAPASPFIFARTPSSGCRVRADKVYRGTIFMASP